jgi:hypothetical protein
MLFHFFHLRHRLPGSAARIISQNFASCRLACSFKAILFFIFNLLTSFCSRLAWVYMGCGIFFSGQHVYRVWLQHLTY